MLPIRHLSLLALAFWLLAVLPLRSHAQHADEAATYTERWRPQYHFTPATGWMGDPSGLVYENGRYHLFYWGHAVSRDLVRWEHWPRALEDSDEIGVMSGSAVMDTRNTSGFGTEENPPMVAIYSGLHFDDRRQTQHIAYSLDRGRTWTEYEGNPVIDIGSTEFRDPQVFWYEPDERWVMVITLSGETKVRFYASDNLIDWTHLSDFGPAGAVTGVWECPDLFELPVDGDPQNTRWVLEVDVQPTGGQYFVGHFDGTTFRADPAFMERLDGKEATPQGVVFADFEGDDYGAWTASGEALGDRPAQGTWERQNAVLGYRGDGLVNTFRNGDATVGTLTSPPFTVEKPYIHFLVGGGWHPDSTSVNLLVDGAVVRSQTGRNMEALTWASWDVRDLAGREAAIEIVDRHTGGWGHINVDHIVFSDETFSVPDRVPAPWIDYGDDFYAVRSWHGMPDDDDRRIWIAWMSNWKYASDVPTAPWTGMQSIPRRLGLKTDAAGDIYLTQRPIAELQTLRRTHWQPAATRIASGELDLTAEGIRGQSLEIIAEFELEDASEFGLKVRQGAGEETVVGYDVAAGSLFVDRTRSGQVDFNPMFPGVNHGPVSLEDGRLRLHLFVDRSSVEVFANDGRTVISDQLFPDPSSDGLSVYAQGGAVRLARLDVWEMGSIWSDTE